MIAQLLPLFLSFIGVLAVIRGWEVFRGILL